jgi:transcriptional regulator with XRE-family HTH domain
MRCPISLGDVETLARAEAQRRRDAGRLSISWLARQSCLTQGAVSNWLAGRRGLKAASLDLVLLALKVRPCELLRPGCDCAVVPAPVTVEPATAPPARPKIRRSPWRRRVDPVAVGLAA